MARYVQHPCKCSPDQNMVLHQVLGQGHDGLNMLQCDKCGQVNRRPVARVSKKKTTWPYYNESCGVTFESESHEQKFAKANNLTKE